MNGQTECFFDLGERTITRHCTPNRAVYLAKCFAAQVKNDVTMGYDGMKIAQVTPSGEIKWYLPNLVIARA